MKMFKISKLENYKAEITETWSRYIPPEHLYYPLIYQNMRESMNGWVGWGTTNKPPENAIKLN